MRRINHNAPDLTPAKLLMILSFVLDISTPILRQGANIDLSLVWREETNPRRCGRYPQETDESEDGGKYPLLFSSILVGSMNYTRKRAYEHKNPSPPSQSPHTIHVLDSGSQQSRESTSKGSGTEHHGKAELHVVAFIEIREI